VIVVVSDVRSQTVVRAWRGRPLEKLYVTLYLDALVMKVKREGRIANRSVHLAVGVNLKGRKGVLLQNNGLILQQILWCPIPVLILGASILHSDKTCAIKV
jgi:hypothetical protein